MRKKFVASGIILFVADFLATFTYEEIRADAELSPFFMIGILAGIVGIILIVTGIFSLLANRL